jgi:hypothetical protein
MRSASPPMVSTVNFRLLSQIVIGCKGSVHRLHNLHRSKVDVTRASVAAPKMFLTARFSMRRTY